MRLLTALIVIAALGWSGYWFVGARALDSAVRAGLDEARAQGVEIETGEIDVSGFPNRFDTRIEAPRVTSPATGVTWSAPFVQIFSLSYRPNRVITVLPETQSLTGPFGEARIETGDARASATFGSTSSLTLDHANLVAEDLRIVSEGVDLTLARLLAATRLAEDDDSGAVHNIGITLDDLDLPPALAERLGGAGRVDGATLDAVVHFDRPVDRESLAGGQIEVQRIEIGRFDLDWAGLGIDAEGALDVGADGSLTGNLDASIGNWSRAVELAAAAGLIAPDRVGSVRQGLGIFAALSGGGDRLNAPLEFRDGGIFMGPVRLADAPRL